MAVVVVAVHPARPVLVRRVLYRLYTLASRPAELAAPQAAQKVLWQRSVSVFAANQK
jgi:hypothetical protein